MAGAHGRALAPVAAAERAARGGTVAVALFVIAGCASAVLISPTRVDRIPPGRYAIMAAHGPAGSSEYTAVLFQLADADIALAMPGVERRSAGAPEEYLNGHGPRFATYELRDVTNIVRGYLLAPPETSIMVWERAARGDLVIIVDDTLEGSHKAGGGGGSSGGSGM